MEPVKKELNDGTLEEVVRAVADDIGPDPPTKKEEEEGAPADECQQCNVRVHNWKAWAVWAACGGWHAVLQLPNYVSQAVEQLNAHIPEPTRVRDFKKTAQPVEDDQNDKGDSGARAVGSIAAGRPHDVGRGGRIAERDVQNYASRLNCQSL